MTDKIIEAARSAGMTTGDNQKHNGEYWWRSLGRPTNVSTSDLARFYALARAEALEDAAKVCDALKEKALTAQGQKSPDDPIDTNLRMIAHLGNGACADAIRALKEQQHV